MPQIETIMLVTLGFVVAALLALFIRRMVWSYGVTLGKRRTERSAPATIAGLQAERDQLRAESAMQGRKLELRLDDLKTRLAEQTAEVSRNRNRIDYLVKEIAKRDEVISERDVQIEQLNHHVEPLEAELATRTQAMQQLKEQLREREDELSSSATGHSKFQTEIAERDDEIAKLRQDVANREARQQEISIEAETAQERLQSQIHELTALSGQIEKQRSDMSEQYSEFAKLQAAELQAAELQTNAPPADAEPEQQQATPVRVNAATSTKPAVNQTKPASGKTMPAAKKTKTSAKKSLLTAKKAKSTAQKVNPAAKKAKPTVKTVKSAAKSVKPGKQATEKAKPVTKKANPTANALRSDAESASFASEAAKAAARNTRPPARDPRPAPDNNEQGSILAAMRKKSIGPSGTSIGQTRQAKDDVDEKVNALNRHILDAERDTGQVQDELKQLDAVWAKKIAALNKAAPKTVSTRARAEKAEKALARSKPNDADDQPAPGRSRQNVISLAARIRAMQKKSAEN